MLGQIGCQPTGASDTTGLWANRIHIAKDNIIDCFGIDPGSFDQSGNAVRPEVSGVHVGQPAASSAHRRSDCVNNKGFGHRLILSLIGCAGQFGDRF